MEHKKLPETEEEWSAMLKEQWTKLDVYSEQKPVPSQTFLIGMLTEHKQRQKRALWRELSVLWLAAAAMLLGGFTLAVTDISVYVMMQLVLFVGILGGLLMRGYVMKRRRRGARHE
ncbi:DUF5345 family protein [Paenibacillus apiarius]|uniref:YxlC family protein n=1 Tax=Paenibacillus apiarius TaxID=46240 RepID=A0ABT4DXC7_9BACL|nr:DUF5345 family protein [Paenibacillus apiarius]MBN3525684.1 DUF5345 family protein [Paenibacillus apiarius]MCY9512955.1 YxlC family protein [Paenibacillus apiarius]MCY9521996.1 YxlC family protein [Paenibacillus apiarius]MCY9555041.1 YxlC family protein [Paenibacillus apiarius]MCY9558061.1 YxlC family protein [Paenibacillus apiarius]